MQTIFEYKPHDSYKRVITVAEARKLHNQSTGEYSFEEATEIASKGGILVFEHELAEISVGTLYAIKVNH